jgi:HEAT repeat protein
VSLSRRGGLAAALLGVSSLAAAAAPRPAAPRPAAPAAAEPAKSRPLPLDKLDKVRALLEGDADDAAIEAAKALAASGASNAGEPLVELLAAGTVPARASAALDALGKLADPKTLEILELYAGHRSPELRKAAIKALGAVHDERAVAPLLARLGDEAPDVRAAAADALAARKEPRAAPRLLALVKRNDAGAAGPLGLLAPPDLVPQLAELAGTVDDGVVGTALGEYVKREDVPDRLRVEVLRTIGHLPGAVGTAALVEYLASIPAKDQRPSKAEAQKLLDERGTK